MDTVRAHQEISIPAGEIKAINPAPYMYANGKILMPRLHSPVTTAMTSSAYQVFLSSMSYNKEDEEAGFISPHFLILRSDAKAGRNTIP